MQRSLANGCAGPAAAASAETLEPRTLLASVPSGFSDSTFYGSGLSKPTAMVFAPDGRLLVTNQAGTLRVIPARGGAALATPFLSLRVDSAGERGLLGVALDPNFTSNRRLYVYYTVPGTSDRAPFNRISRFTASSTNPNVMESGSERIIMELDPLSATNHNGGAMHFGADGMLYVATGDNAVGSRSQSLGNRHGKMLRINVNGDDFPSDARQNYAVPSSNPFLSQTTGHNRAVWALGLRNPYTFSIQPGTGRMFINDVGQDGWEEINEGVAGANYGWPGIEGVRTTQSIPSIGAYRNPFYAYSHGGSSNQGYAITGGIFYNPPTASFPSSYMGDYFFADYVSNWIRKLDDPANNNSNSNFATAAGSPVDLRVGPDGELYYLSRANNAVGRIVYSAGMAASISQHPASQSVAPGSSVTFRVSASGSEPLTYQWQRALPGGSFTNISGATGSSYTFTAQSSDHGAQYRASVDNTYGPAAVSNAATLTITSNQAPTPTITAPGTGALYRAGDTITFSGAASDPEQGTLPASAFTWRVDFHHDSHAHPFMPDTTGVTTGSFTIPRLGETSSNVWYRIHLTVRDQAGAVRSTFRDVLPRKSTITLSTAPLPLPLNLDGQPRSTPASIVSVEGMTRTLEAPQFSTGGGRVYEFISWTDGGARRHAINTPIDDTTYTATYRPSLRFDFGTDVSPVQGGYNRVAPGMGYSASRGFGFTAGTRYGRDRGTGDTLKRDFILARDATFAADVTPGAYDVTVTVGDSTYAHDSQAVVIEGVQVDSITTAVNQYVTRTYRVNVFDGQLTLRMRDRGGSDVNTVLNAVTLAPVSTSTFSRSYDFGTSGSPVASGYTRVSDATAFSSSSGFGWISGTRVGRDRGTSDALRRDLVQTRDATFGVNLSSGTYDVTLTVGDASYRHDQQGIILEGVQRDSITTAVGQFIVRTYRVAVSDGQLTLRLRDLGGTDVNAVVNAMVINRV